MKEAISAMVLQDGELELINQYTRHPLTEAEAFIFSVVLCDNDVDKDYERFTVEALEKLAELFIGKTGIVEYSNSNTPCRIARIISCTITAVPDKKTKLGDDYFRLIARAFIRKTELNENAIERIKNGAIKEVSVGCSVSKTLCSICGNEINSCSCPHVKGRKYLVPGSFAHRLCCGELCEPYEAYEFTFVPIDGEAQVTDMDDKMESGDNVRANLRKAIGNFCSWRNYNQLCTNSDCGSCDMTKAYDMAREPEVNDYYVTLKVDARYFVKVQASNLEEAKRIAMDKWLDADIGDLEETNGEIIYMENEEGDFVYEK